jgi:hypothetical protein
MRFGERVVEVRMRIGHDGALKPVLAAIGDGHVARANERSSAAWVRSSVALPFWARTWKDAVMADVIEGHTRFMALPQPTTKCNK